MPTTLGMLDGQTSIYKNNIVVRFYFNKKPSEKFEGFFNAFIQKVGVPAIFNIKAC